MNQLISVIVPVSNVAAYLPRCVDSLLAQVYQTLQIILVDDGSTDGSAAICDAYAEQDTRIEVIHQPYGGVSDARNAGVDAARGDYILFLDSDDEADPQYASKLYHTLIEHDLDISQCCLLRVRNGTPVNPLDVRPEVQIFDGMQMQMRIFNRDRYFTMCLCGKLFRRSLFDGLRFPVGRINEDESLIYLLMYRARRVGVIDDYLYLYHYNSESITERKYNIHRLDSFYMLREKYAFYKEQGHTEFADKTANEYFSQMSVALLNGKKQADDYPAIRKKAKQLYREDRDGMLAEANLVAGRGLFVALSHLSFSFVPLYGRLLRLYLKKRQKS